MYTISFGHNKGKLDVDFVFMQQGDTLRTADGKVLHGPGTVIIKTNNDSDEYEWREYDANDPICMQKLAHFVNQERFVIRNPPGR